MSQASKYLKSVKAINALKSRESAESTDVQTTSLNPEMAKLRIWQSERLKKTHADLLKSRRYGPACLFFLNDIYAPRDFSQRNNDIEYLYEVMSSILPNFLLKLVRNSVALNNLTEELDNQLLKVLLENIGAIDNLTPEGYTEGYRLCDNYDKRVQQINLIVEIGNQVDFSTRIPFVGTALRLARKPAYNAGWGDVHDFLETGFKSFKHMRGAKKFLATIEKREKQILDHIYAGDTNPF